MRSIANVVIFSMVVTASCVSQTAQTRPAKSKDVKAESYAVKMPEGMSKHQADQMLTELKAIRQLLEHLPSSAAQPRPIAAGSDKVQMSVIPGWSALGRDDAPVTMVEFADYQCPFCRKFHSETFVQLKKNYIDTGKLRYISRDLPLEFHPNAPGAAVAARCAGEQHKFWEMRDLMMANSAHLSLDFLTKYGAQINLEMTTFRACLNDNKYASAIQKDIADADALGIRGTPSFVVGRSGEDRIEGVRIVGAASYAAFETAINDVLSATPEDSLR